MKKIMASLLIAAGLCNFASAGELDNALSAIDKAGEMLQDKGMSEVGSSYFDMIIGAVEDALQNHEDDSKLNEFKEHFQAAKDISSEYVIAEEEDRPEMESKLDEYKNEVGELKEYIQELKDADENSVE